MRVVSRRVEFPCRPSSAALARDVVREALRGCPVADTVELVAAELASNAIRHTCGERFWVQLDGRRTMCRVAVEDEGPLLDPDVLPGFPAVEDVDPLAEGGRGLPLVALLCAKDVGVERSPRTAGLIVWGRVCW